MINHTQPNQQRQRPPQQPAQHLPQHRAHRPPSSALKNRRLWWLIGGMFALGTLAIIGMMGVLLLVYVAQPRIAPEVRVAGVVIGGQTLTAAQQALEEGYGARQLTLTDAERQWQVGMTDLGITLDLEATMAQAKTAAAHSVVAPVYQIDFAQTQAKLIALSADINIPAIDGNPPEMGRSIDIPFVLDRLRLNLDGEIANDTLALSMIEVEGRLDATADYTGVPVQHTVGAGEELGLIALKYNVAVADIVRLNNIADANLLYVGQVLTIPAAGQYQPTQTDAPPAPLAAGKSILVSNDAQRIYAYENGVLVRSHLVSTGLAATPTILGDFRVQRKYVATDMRGADYYLPDVPYTMYYHLGYAIHGTYWHNSFGRPMSHGCVNLPPDEARWFYEWAEVGTLVRVV